MKTTFYVGEMPVSYRSKQNIWVAVWGWHYAVHFRQVGKHWFAWKVGALEWHSKDEDIKRCAELSRAHFQSMELANAPD